MVFVDEREEALIRVLIAIVALVILGIWNQIIILVGIVHWIYVITTGERLKDLAKFSNLWASYVYKVYRYISFSTNVRPWPFADFGKPIEKVDMKKPKK